MMIMETMNTINTINTYNFNTNADTTPLFRIKCIKSQLEANKKNATNSAIQTSISQVIDICKFAADTLSDIQYYNDGTNVEEYWYHANRYAKQINKKKEFLASLLELMDPEHHDYPILKYTISVLDEGYIYGNSDSASLDDPKD